MAKYLAPSVKLLIIDTSSVFATSILSGTTEDVVNLSTNLDVIDVHDEESW